MAHKGVITLRFVLCISYSSHKKGRGDEYIINAEGVTTKRIAKAVRVQFGQRVKQGPIPPVSIYQNPSLHHHKPQAREAPHSMPVISYHLTSHKTANVMLMDRSETHAYPTRATISLTKPRATIQAQVRLPPTQPLQSATQGNNFPRGSPKNGNIVHRVEMKYTAFAAM